MLKIQFNDNVYQQKPNLSEKKISFCAIEKTLFALKPDAFERKINADIISSLVQKSGEFGFKLQKVWFGQPPKELMERHYAEHKGKSFFGDLIAYVTRGKMYAVVVEGEDAVSKIRGFARDIRAKYVKPGEKTENLVHSSDSVKSAEREIENFFPSANLDKVA